MSNSSPFARLGAVAILATLALGLAGCASERPAEVGDLLPADTLLWLRCQHLDTLDEALERQGLMDLIVEELNQPEVRRELADDWGLSLTDDPRRDIARVLGHLARVDVSLHPGDAEALITVPEVAIVLEARDEAAADTLEAFVAGIAPTSEVWGETTVHRVPTGDEQILVLRHGRRLLASPQDSLLRTLHAALDVPPAVALAATAEYRRARGDGDHDVELYLASALEMGGFWPAVGPQAAMLADLDPALEKYGAKTAWLAMDYLLGDGTVRTFVPTDSPLAPLLDDPPVSPRTLAALPADTYAMEVVTLHEPARKVTLLKEIVGEVMAATTPHSDVPPLAQAPIQAAEAALGMPLEDLVADLTEVAIAGASEPGVVVLLRTADAAAAGKLEAALAASPALAFLQQGSPHTAGEVVLRTFRTSVDGEGPVHALGRRGETVMLLAMADDLSELDTYLRGLEAGTSVADAVPALVTEHLEQRGHAWFMLDLQRLAAAWDLDLAEGLADLPPPLAQRLATLVMAGHVAMVDDDVVQTRWSASGP
jgi:hypothetical protein